MTCAWPARRDEARRGRGAPRRRLTLAGHDRQSIILRPHARHLSWPSSSAASSFRPGASGAGAAALTVVSPAPSGPIAPARSAGDRGCPEARRDRAARPGRDRGEEAAGRRRARGPRRSHSVSEGDRESRARAGGRADDARHGVRSGVADQGRGDDDQRDDARRAGAHQAERPRVVLHPRLRTLRQGRHHRSVTC